MKTALNNAIDDLNFMLEQADHPFAEIAYGLAVRICELHLEQEKAILILFAEFINDKQYWQDEKKFWHISEHEEIPPISNIELYNIFLIQLKD